jgi:hypothetical protein
LWRYYRRISSEPPTSCDDSSNALADDEFYQDDGEEQELIPLALPVPSFNRRKILIVAVFVILTLGTALLLLCMFSDPFVSFLSDSYRMLRSKN